MLGEGAPTCSFCKRDLAIAGLTDDGFVPVPVGHRLPYIDCGVEVRSIGYLGDARTWVPWWARRAVELMHVPGIEGGYCGPSLKRAAEDEAFRHAFEALLRLVTGLPNEHARARLNGFAASQGITPLAPVTS